MPRAGEFGRRLSLTFSLVACAGLAAAQQDEWEYEADEGYHREEWYDPSDWFNEDGRISYESDRTASGDELDRDFGWHYDWDPVANEWVSDYGWHDDDTLYDHYANDFEHYDHYGGLEEDYGWHYDWNAAVNRWESDYGWHEEGLSGFGPDPEYGWYYSWDRESGTWEREYGWHDSEYEYVAWKDRRQGRRANASRQERSSEQQASFTGRIDSFNRVRLKDSRDSHTLVRLRMRDGSTRIVDIGPRVGLSELDLAQGDRVVVRGRKGRISDHQVLMANAIRVDGERTRLRRGDAPRGRAQEAGFRSGEREQSQEPDEERGRRARLSGQLADFEQASLKGSKEEHLFVRMTLEDGSSRVVDLGPAAHMQEIGLEEGARVTVEGREERRSDGRRVLCAETLKIGGETVELDGYGKDAEKQKEKRKQEAEQDRQAAAERASTKDRATIRGRLDAFRRVAMDDVSGDHLFVRLRMQDGSARVVDLGPSAKLSEIDLESGDTLMVQGVEKTFQGDRVLVADKMRVEGERVESVGREGDGGS